MAVRIQENFFCIVIYSYFKNSALTVLKEMQSSKLGMWKGFTDELDDSFIENLWVIASDSESEFEGFVV